MDYDKLSCPDCPSYKYCRGKIMKGSSVCDSRRGLRGKKKTRRFNYLREMLGR